MEKCAVAYRHHASSALQGTPSVPIYHVSVAPFSCRRPQQTQHSASPLAAGSGVRGVRAARSPLAPCPCSCRLQAPMSSPLHTTLRPPCPRLAAGGGVRGVRAACPPWHPTSAAGAAGGQPGCCVQAGPGCPQDLPARCVCVCVCMCVCVCACVLLAASAFGMHGCTSGHAWCSVACVHVHTHSQARTHSHNPEQLCLLQQENMEV